MIKRFQKPSQSYMILQFKTNSNNFYQLTPKKQKQILSKAYTSFIDFTKVSLKKKTHIKPNQLLSKIIRKSDLYIQF